MSLAMMDFPVQVVETHLLKSIDRTPMPDLLKVGRKTWLLLLLLLSLIYFVDCYSCAAATDSCKGRCGCYRICLFGL